MDQKVIAGVGNVYRAEVLFRHGIDPYRPGKDLTRAEWDAIWADLVTLMREGVRNNRIDTVRPEHMPEAMGRPPRVDDHGGEVYVYRRAEHAVPHLRHARSARPTSPPATSSGARPASAPSHAPDRAPARLRTPRRPDRRGPCPARLRSPCGSQPGAQPCASQARRPSRAPPPPRPAAAPAPARPAPARPATSPPRYADPSSRTDSARSAGSSVRLHDAPPFASPVSRQRPAFHGQNASSTSNTTSTGARYVRASSAAPSVHQPYVQRVPQLDVAPPDVRDEMQQRIVDRPVARLDRRRQVDLEEEPPQRRVRRRVQRRQVVAGDPALGARRVPLRLDAERTYPTTSPVPLRQHALQRRRALAARSPGRAAPSAPSRAVRASIPGRPATSCAYTRLARGGRLVRLGEPQPDLVRAVRHRQPHPVRVDLQRTSAASPTPYPNRP